MNLTHSIESLQRAIYLKKMQLEHVSEYKKQQLKDEITQHTVAIQYLKDNEI
jgi:hypothetical protein